MDAVQEYIQIYRTNAEDIQRLTANQRINSMRDAACQSLLKTGLPTRKVERYKYTDVGAAFAYNYGLDLRHIEVNAAEPQLVVDHYGTVADITDGITAINTMLLQDFSAYHIQGQVGPLSITNHLRGNIDQMRNRRVLIVMDNNSEASIRIVDAASARQETAGQETQGTEQSATQAAGQAVTATASFLSTQVVEVIMGDNCHLDLYELSELTDRCTRFSNIYIKVGRDCTVRHNNICLTGNLNRSMVNVSLQGPGSEVWLNGLAIAGGSQHVDVNTLVDHKVSGCQSHELYKFIVDDQAVGAFAGRILVREGAQKTISDEVNQNICATNEARMFTQPMLEIYADDVRCSHGSTVGKLDEAALFYMQQRGIPLQQARILLMQAFASEVINQMKSTSMRDRLHLITAKRLQGVENKCSDCDIC